MLGYQHTTTELLSCAPNHCYYYFFVISIVWYSHTEKLSSLGTGIFKSLYQAEIASLCLLATQFLYLLREEWSYSGVYEMSRLLEAVFIGKQFFHCLDDWLERSSIANMESRCQKRLLGDFTISGRSTILDL